MQHNCDYVIILLLINIRPALSHYERVQRTLWQEKILSMVLQIVGIIMTIDSRTLK